MLSPMLSPGETLTLEPLTGYPEVIGRDLWRLEDARGRTLKAVQGLTQAQRAPPGVDSGPAAQRLTLS